MEHPCYKCRQTIEEGIPFCPYCQAPQIRVAAPEQLSPSTASFPGEVSPEAVPLEAGRAGTAVYPSQVPSSVQWQYAWKGALLAGIGAAVLTSVPLLLLGCVFWFLSAGALAVSFYRKRIPGLITAGMGARIGALAGFFGFLVYAVFSTIGLMLLRSGGEFTKALQEQMDRQVGSNPDPHVQQMMQQLVDWVSTPTGLATIYVLGLTLLAFLFVALAAGGGALAATMSSKHREFR